MKFNPRSMRAWITSLVAAVNLLTAIPLGVVLARRRQRRAEPRRVVLFGHDFYGNLKAFYEGADWEEAGFDCRFLYLDSRKYRSADQSWALSSFNPAHMVWVAGADVVIADRGLGVLGILRRLRPRLKTVQAWHGVGYKGYPPEVVAKFRHFSQLWAPSQAFRDVWHGGGAGLSLDRIVQTGMARTDPLVVPRVSRDELMKRYGIDQPTRAVVLVAPTWAQDDRRREIFPFAMTRDAFLRGLSEWAVSHQSTVVVREHINTTTLSTGSLGTDDVAEHPGVLFRSMDRYPNTDDLLLLSDVLVSDWSGIAADFMILARPIVYLDVPSPFRHGWGVLNQLDRPGRVVRSFAELSSALSHAVTDPDAFAAEFGEQREAILHKAFDETLDGRSADRCLDALCRLTGVA